MFRPSNDERNLSRQLEQASLFPRGVVAQEITVIRGQDNDRVVVEAVGIQASKQTANLIVDMGHS